MYEPLLWYNGSSSTKVIPWLAQSYSTSSDKSTLSFTLRGNITFADGAPLNSSAVYFSLTRLLVMDGSSPAGHGSFGPGWALSQVENHSLSSLFGTPQNYTPSWVESVLGQNFVSITGPLTFNLHVMHATAALPYLLASPFAGIVDPGFVMAHDLALWSAANSTYLLPFPTLSGSLATRMGEYFKDEAATCNAGSTPQGCGYTYLDSSASGSTAGTGPYVVKSVAGDQTVTLEARQDYWGGAARYYGGKTLTPKILTVNIVNVPVQSDRTRDLIRSAAHGGAMMIALNTTFDSARLFDVANQTDWLTQGKLASILPNVTIAGPQTSFTTSWFQFDSNVTLPSGSGPQGYRTFQPFADRRFRLAFADAVDMSAMDKQFNNNLGQVAVNLIPPGLPPAGSFNSSDLPKYRYDLTAVKDLLLAAMKSPLTTFHFLNGTLAPPGVFNNAFGCSQLDSQNRCDNPIQQTIHLLAFTGDTANIGILNQISAVIGNVSRTYNMGLQVVVNTETPATYYPSHYDMVWTGWAWDYPWVGDFDVGNLAPPALSASGWNVSSLTGAWTQFQSADASGDLGGILSANDRLNELANQMVLQLWTFYPYSFAVFTSNIQGYYYNPSLYATPFASLSLESPPQPGSSLLSYPFLLVVALLAVLPVIAVGVYVTRRRSNRSAAALLQPPAVGRRLAAIMFTDMVGYTAMAQKDEARSMRLLDEQRSLVRPAVASHQGTEVKTMGDAFLVEFSSALEAVRCAFDIQSAVHRFNSGRLADERVRLRVGVHIGDVIHSKDDVYGDAVNVASRIEPLAEPGGVCVTSQVYAAVKNKVDLQFSTLGMRELKNVEEAVEVYKIVLPWGPET